MVAGWSREFVRKVSKTAIKLRQVVEVVEVDEPIDDGVDSQTRGGVDIEFAGDVFAVRNDGMLRDTKHIGYLFIAQAPNDLNEHIPLTV